MSVEKEMPSYAEVSAAMGTFRVLTGLREVADCERVRILRLVIITQILSPVRVNLYHIESSCVP